MYDILNIAFTLLLFSVSGILIFWMILVFIFFIRNFRRSKKAGISDIFNVSVVIPVYNEEKNIERCIKSILSSEYPKDRIEVIVVDDGSTDNTVDIVKDFDDVKLIQQRHLGKASALNVGIKKASNELVLTIDADTILRKDAIKNIVGFFSNERLGAVTGMVKVRNKNGILSAFQSVEYIYNSLLREAFSSIFGSTNGICGALTCYRKSVIEKVGGFRKNTSAEDFDISLYIRKFGYEIIATNKAIGYTTTPNDIISLFKQRLRWWRGGLQGFVKHKDMLFKKKYGLSTSYMLFTHIFWYIYALFALPLIVYHILYWFPYNTGGILDVLFYLIRWFSILGPIYLIYMIPEWGLSYMSLFAVLSAIFTILMISLALKHYEEGINMKRVIIISFYFAYTIILSIMFVGSTFSFIAKKGKGTFLK